jgi:uncharacterized protein YbaP (TraB family)
MRVSIILWLLFGFIWTFGQTYNPSGKLLWEIKKQGKVSYLWGTLHSNDKELFDFPDSVYWAFQKSQFLAIEVDLFSFFLHNDPIPDNFLAEIDEHGQLYTSSQAASQTYYGSEDGMPQFMDAFFQDEAEKRKMPILALETPYSQGKAIQQTPLLENTSMGLNSDAKALKSFYIDGRIDLIDQLMRVRLSAQKEAYKKLIENRNAEMSNRLAVEYTKSGVFSAIGSAHLYGKKGIIELLRNKGFSVRPMGLTKSQSMQQKWIGAKVEYLDTIEGSIVKVYFPSVPRTFENVVECKELGQGNTYRLSLFGRDTTLNFLEIAELYIASPSNAPYIIGVLDDGTQYAQGLSNAYKENVTWKRVLINETHVLVISCRGGNKFMNSDRPNRFFNTVILE